MPRHCFFGLTNRLVLSRSSRTSDPLDRELRLRHSSIYGRVICGRMCWSSITDVANGCTCLRSFHAFRRSPLTFSLPRVRLRCKDTGSPMLAGTSSVTCIEPSRKHFTTQLANWRARRALGSIPAGSICVGCTSSQSFSFSYAVGTRSLHAKAYFIMREYVVGNLYGVCQPSLS